MRFTEWKGEVPKKKGRGYHHLEDELNEFMKMNVKAAKVAWTELEYKNVRSCYEGLLKAAKRFNFPVYVTTRKGEVFLVRRDI